MTRIFSTLALVNALALVASVVTGLVSQLADGLHHPPTFLTHFTTGLFTAIGTLFVHCLIFTYFLGTGRWVKEVGLAYDLPDARLPRQTRELKRRTFPPALLAMLVTIATAAAGMGNQRQEWPRQVHGALALATLLVHAWAFFIEYRNVRANGLIIEEVMREVDRIRRERGLPSNAEDLERHEV
jgi:hypothetical protein